jgi:hypothetical protein
MMYCLAGILNLALLVASLLGWKPDDWNEKTSL